MARLPRALPNRFKQRPESSCHALLLEELCPTHLMSVSSRCQKLNVKSQAFSAFRCLKTACSSSPSVESWLFVAIVRPQSKASVLNTPNHMDETTGVPLGMLRGGPQIVQGSTKVINLGLKQARMTHGGRFDQSSDQVQYARPWPKSSWTILLSGAP